MLGIQLRAGAFDVCDEICGVGAVVAVFLKQIGEHGFEGGHRFTLRLSQYRILPGDNMAFSIFHLGPKQGLLHPFSKVIFMGILAGLLSLAGCDQQRIIELEEGVATEADVRGKFGEPEKIWEGEGGARIFEYNRQPAGHRNYMITIGTDGKMSALRQVLTPANFAKVQPGMMMEDVRKLLGKPGKVIPYELKRETYYNWRYLADQNNTSMIFSAVMNADMKVLRTESGLDPEDPKNGMTGSK